MAAPPSLAVYVSWHIWIERNKSLFEDASPSYRAVCYRTLSTFHWQQSSIKPILYKVVDSLLPTGHSVAFFDGAASSTGLCCGAGGIFKTHPERTTKLVSLLWQGFKYKGRAAWPLGDSSACFQLVP
jgi:hypothetical protein